eukprot:GFUD01029284.1.p1 GENE.GFUD01029284.1~~GFUD01029284.1.p1  ORF type:complete len:582 (-),score=149.51 GFUD01029284.1:36-1781(-)
MAAKFRNLVAAKSLKTLKTLNNDFEASNRALAGKLKLNFDKKSRIFLKFTPCVLQNQNDELLSDFVKLLPLEEDGISGVDHSEDNVLKFYLHNPMFVDHVVKTTFSRPPDYAWSRNALFPEDLKHVLVEFSSPNIAKPFHVGHFRSTILGNFVANINKAVGNQVTKINYLGDWGTQFGLLIAGLEESEIAVEAIKRDPIKTLLEVYVKANALAEKNPEFGLKARNAFNELENGDHDKLEVWKMCREFTIDELNKNYAKLNVEFDHFHGESMYSTERSEQVIKRLRECDLIKDLEDGRKVIEVDDKNRVTIIKSDGSSLYISRDIAAALDRKEKFDFDKMIYVVDNSQGSHFQNLFKILDKLGCDWSNNCEHVKFGKILGISTRKGNMVYISDLIEEATDIMLENQDKSENTRIFGDQKLSNAEAVGISALIINDLKQKRTKDYKFSWAKALSHSGDTGVKLQYTHARLTSLIDTAAVNIDHSDVANIDTTSLTESIALELIYHIGRYDEVICLSHSTLEPHHLVQYLFTLCNTTSKALTVLQVKTAPDPVTAQARLLVFQCARKTLAEGLTILGIEPLEKI